MNTTANTALPTILLQAVQLLVEQEERMQQIQDEQSRQRKQLDAIAQHQSGDDGTEYMTALAFCRQEGESALLAFAHWLGILANDLCRDIQVRNIRVPDERWGTVNSYPVEVLRDCLAAIDDQAV